MRIPTLAVLALAPLLLLQPGMASGELPRPKTGHTARPDSALERDLALARRALADGRTDVAGTAIEHALERDLASVEAWDLRSQWAAATGDEDRRIRALHRAYELARAQGLDGIRAREAALFEADPRARELFGLRERMIPKLREVAARYARDGWPHAAIAVHRSILALDPENVASQDAIAELASAPDPSLAADARQVDLLEGISADWIAAHDAEHADWKSRAKLEAEHYVTETDAGYEVLVRSSAAMEQMNAFYRRFFQYGDGEHGKQVPRIALRIFRDSQEYLALGSGPPAKWSDGQFTGSAVETYVGQGGFQAMTGTLFHEAAHQFVSLATNAAGWLNEGLASFFEGTRMLANGTVQMNLPADHRLFPLATRMERGWMRDANDGITEDPNVVPTTAPTFRIVLENAYTWGPAWYAPTWGVVYFLYDYQDPVDGRFVYRKAFREYIDRSGGLVGDSAVRTFEEVVLAQPEPPTPGIAGTLDGDALPRDVDALGELWRTWILELRDVRSGLARAEHPWVRWARYAVQRGDRASAAEFFEKGLEADPDSVDVLRGFGEFLLEQPDGVDRGVKLLRLAARALERSPEAEETSAHLREVQRLLDKHDPERKRLARIHADMLRGVVSIAEDYAAAGLDRQTMAVTRRFARELDSPELAALYREAVAREGESLARWQLVYDEESLEGWATKGTRAFTPNGPFLEARFEDSDAKAFDYRFLTLDRVTSGDFSIEAEVQASPAQATFAGLVFGRKSGSDFHALILFPPDEEKLGYADLATFHGGDAFDTWRHEPVSADGAVGSDTAGPWHRLRVEVTGRIVDVWVDGHALASQEFPSRAVLQGSFGLLTGVGRARFRRVRFLARDPEDPAPAIERALRTPQREMSGSVAEPGADPVDVSTSGSWVGLHPPFPIVDAWLRGERSSWRERRGYPQLLALFSIDQNQVLPIDTWLAALARRHADVGLEVIGVLHTWDRDRAEDFLGRSPFPGAVALDAKDGGEQLGKTFQAYSIDRYQVPRLILVDVDGTVVWEGAPGFSAGRAWSGESTFLDAPLAALLKRRKLAEVTAWRGRWEAAAAALHEGRIADAWPVLEEASAFDPEAFPLVGAARGKRAQLERLFTDFDQVAAELQAQGRTPAAAVILDWARAADRPIDSPLARKLGKDASQKAWERALAFLKPALRNLEAGKPVSFADRILDRMDALEGPFAASLAADLRAAQADPEALAALCRGAAGRPARWLLEKELRW